MKRSTTLRLIVLFLACGFLVSCASNQHRPIHRSAVPEQCVIQSNRDLPRTNNHQQPPPSPATPIRGNFGVGR